MYLKSSEQPYGELIVDNAGQDNQATTPLLESIGLDMLTVRNRGYLDVPSGIEVGVVTPALALHDAGEMILHGRVFRTGTANGEFDLVDVATSSELTVDQGGGLSAAELRVSSLASLALPLNVVQSLAVDQLELLSGGTFLLNTSATFGGMHVAADGLLTHAPGQAGFNLTVTGDMTVDAGGAVRVDGRGYAGASGPGAGQSYGAGQGSAYAGGGAHGGGGGDATVAGGTGYGSLPQPAELGSGGTASWNLAGLPGVIHEYGGAGA
ncbi:MAG: hypothetical protein IPJ27_23440 [Candidatus Accumulibacter sp.]|uniref:Uncharacterized protein n=1 Tax=Candidatus Accumulibacter proximus TaxID=2954385 RepID=A0A935Q4K2_9PROT|nr:hypothetical protein [Candidatus Accumulibacter proximus]